MLNGGSHLTSSSTFPTTASSDARVLTPCIGSNSVHVIASYAPSCPHRLPIFLKLVAFVIEEIRLSSLSFAITSLHHSCLSNLLQLTGRSLWGIEVILGEPLVHTMFYISHFAICLLIISVELLGRNLIEMNNS